MKKRFPLIVLCGSCLLSGCGGGSPKVSLSTSTLALSTASLTFGDEVVGTTSQPLTVTLTNSGTAALSIASITVSADFEETNNCVSPLAPGAKCTINVTFTPNSTGSLSGTISVTDNAAGSPQTVSLSGTGATGTTQDTLTGDCWGAIKNGAPNQCGTGQDTTQCPVGQLAITPTTVGGCLPPQSMLVDTSTTCHFMNTSGESGSGSCVVQASAGGSCSVQGQECGASQLPPCCPGLSCVPASTRAFCQ
jgi:hypothetical protein